MRFYTVGRPTYDLDIPKMIVDGSKLKDGLFQLWNSDKGIWWFTVHGRFPLEPSPQFSFCQKKKKKKK